MPLYPSEDTTCPFCGTNMELVYLCEDCHETICEDCLITKAEDTFLCLNCGSNEIVTDKQGQLMCTACGHSQIRTIKKVVPTCPNCEGHNIVKIVDKQSQLLNQFKQIVQKSREFITPFEETVTKLNDLRQLLYRLREDSPKCYHYPTLESDLLIVFKLFIAAKNNVHDQVSTYFQDMQRNLNFINEITITHPSNLPYIAGIIKNFERENEKIAKNALDAIVPINTRVNPLIDKLTFMDEIQATFNLFLGKITLAQDEKIIFALNCKLAEGNSQGNGMSSKNGTILLTNKKIYFFHQQGVFKKKSVLLFSVDINDLQQVGVKGRLKKQVSLEFLNSMYRFTITKDNREKLIEWIEKARVFDSSATQDDDNFKKLEKFKLNIKLFREELENAIYQLIGMGTATGSLQGSRSLAHSLGNETSGKFSPKGLFEENDNEAESVFSPVNSMGNKAHNCLFPDDNIPKSPVPEPPRPMVRTYKDLRTPVGHYGLPHDKEPYQHAVVNNPYYAGYSSKSTPKSMFDNNGSEYADNANRYQVPTPQGRPEWNQPSVNRYSTPAVNPMGPIPPMPETMDSYGPSQYGKFPDASEYNLAPNPMQSPLSPRGRSPISSNPIGNTFAPNEENQLRTNLQRNKQEEFGLIQTLKMLEQRYDAGSINHPEFVKSYRELQKELFILQEKSKQIAIYLKDTYGLNGN